MKKALIIAILFIVVGVVICIGALYSIGFDFSKLQTVEMTERTQYISGSFEDISIQTVESDLIIRKSNDGECRLVSTARKGTVFSAEITNEALMIEEKNAPGSKWWDNVGIQYRESKVILYLPETAYESIAVNTVSGDVVLPRDFYFGFIGVQSTSGDIKVNADTDGQVGLKSSSGDVYLSKRQCADVTVMTVSGDIELSGVESNGSLVLKSTSGDIEFKACDGKNVKINTVSGDVEGSFISGKDFSVDTTSGNVEIPLNSSGAPCVINTVSGDIEIEI